MGRLGLLLPAGSIIGFSVGRALLNWDKIFAHYFFLLGDTTRVCSQVFRYLGSTDNGGFHRRKHKEWGLDQGNASSKRCATCLTSQPSLTGKGKEKFTYLDRYIIYYLSFAPPKTSSAGPVRRP